ncbi:MAG: hypothetical protein HOW97_00355 [Catenulispora sp.]|nr:hypothetical protein [Catenulispora sp.]
MADGAFKAAVVGPTRVGKTSLLTAVFTETQDRLGGTELNIELDERTERLVHQHQIEQRAVLEQTEFNGAVLAGTQNIEMHGITLRSLNEESLAIPFDVLDFPGKWLDPEERRQARLADGRWTLCERHIRESMLLLVPIDAAVLMEAVTNEQKLSSYRRLGIVHVENMVRLWARSRNMADHQQEPATLMLVPVKCEKYLGVNQRPGADPDALRARVRDMYGRVLTVVANEARHRRIDVLYNPVDTFGCVELVEGHWVKADADDGEGAALALSPRYRLIGKKPEIRVTGASAIMRELAGAVLAGRAALEAEAERISVEEQAKLLARRAEAKGFWGTLVFRFGGELSENKASYHHATQAEARARRNRAQLDADMKKLVDNADTSRSENWTVMS